MPTTYTHYRLGQEVKEALTGTLKEAVLSNEELFDIGLHGPDILFYYNALKKNWVNRLGGKLHDLPGSYFFENAAKVIEKQDAKQGYLAYAYGFLCHFALDVCCHGYIGEKVKNEGISHAEIEAELDREFMTLDGLDPVSHKVTGHLKASMENAHVIQAFFPNVNEGEIQKTLKDMIFYLDTLVAPSKVKRGMLLGAMRIAGLYDSMHGLIVNYEKNPNCEEITKTLLTKYEEAKTLVLQLIPEYEAYVNGSGALRDCYRYNFESEIPEGEDAANEI